jgi:ABC-type multidrug transport system fused ATPase/permease subunit
LLTGGLLALAGVLNVLLPLSIGAFYHVALHDNGAKNKLLKALAINVHSTSAFFSLFSGLVAALFVVIYLSHLCEGILIERFSRDLRGSLFAAQMHHSLTSHRSRPVGKYLLRYSGDLRSVQDLLRKGVLRFSSDVVFLVLAFGALCWLDMKLGLVVLGFFIVSMVVVHAIGIPLRTLGSKRRDQRSVNMAFVSARLQAFRTIKSFNRETREIAGFDRTNEKLYARGIRFVRLNTFLHALVPALFYSSLGVVLMIMARQVENGEETLKISEILGFVLLMLYTRSAMRRVLWVNSTWQTGRMALRKLIAVLDQETEPRTEGAVPDAVEKDVVFRQVNFAYQPGAWVVRDLNARFAARSLTLLSGPAGSGKSTVLALIHKLYAPASGVITIAGADLSGLSAFAVRKEVTIVSEDMPLLGDTVLEAITYNAREKSEEKALRILQRLNIRITGDAQRDLAFELEEQGNNLSRGQRRMLQFARALLTGKPVLLLDEPFKDLDPKDLRTITNELNDLRAKRTIILACSSVPPDLIVDHTIDLTTK